MRLRREAPDDFRPDEIYYKLAQLGAGKTDRDARQAMAALLLLLVNHIGDEAILDEALDIVRSLPSTTRKLPEHDGDRLS